MNEFSRTKKHESLRDTINNNSVNKTNTNEEGLPNQNKEQKKNNESYLVDETGDFKNEYLDSFIQEVREYNIKKGNRENEDTRLDILQQLSQKQRLKRATYIEDDKRDTVVEAQIDKLPQNDTNLKEPQNTDELTIDKSFDAATTQEIARQVQELLANESKPEMTRAKEPEVKTDEVKKVPEIIPNEVNVNHYDSALKPQPRVDEQNLDEYTQSQLLEQTQQLKVQLDETRNNLNDINDGIDQNNKMLNIIIAVLIIVLLGVIGVVVYWLISGGII